jgi:DNA-binding MarR family transcriptional regulator
MSSRDNDDVELVRNWAMVVRAIDGVQQAFGVRLESLGMSLPYFSVLTLLMDAQDRRLPMSRIARDLSMTSGGFTKLADRMARDGLIDRRGSSGDRRVVFAALTEEGLQLARRAEAAYRAFLREQVADVVSASDLATLSKIANRLGAALAAAEPEGPPFEIAPRTPDAPERRSRREP